MIVISIAFFLLYVGGIILFLNLTPSTVTEDINTFLRPKESLQTQTMRVQKNQKPGLLRRTLQEAQDVLEYMNQSNKFAIACMASVLLSVFGVVISIAIGNAFLIPAMTVGCFSIPFIFIRLYSYSYTKHIQSELEIALSQVTTSYLRTTDIVRSVEENLDNIQEPIRKVFQEFVGQIKFINPNERQAIDDMREKINDDIFKEWCDALKRCSQNHTLKYMLVPVVRKFETLRSITSSINEAITTTKIQFGLIVAIVYAQLPMLYLLNKDWYSVLEKTVQGHACIGIIALATVITTLILVFITKPIKYKV